VAGDLIPPPSPAGRPTPDAPRLVELPPEPAAAAAVDSDPPPLEPSEYRNRFGFMLGALIGVVVAIVGVLAVVLTSGGDSSKEALAVNWSSWQPANSDAATGAAEIANHLGPRYKLDDGTQLVQISASQISVPVAIRPPGGDIKLISGRGVLYTLNGLGPGGSIITGKPTAQRLLLLRREALELALYSFRYLNGVDMVVALLPPKPPKKAKPGQAATPPKEIDAVFYRPGDLLPQLQVPERVTLANKTLRPKTIADQEASRVASLTASNIFKATTPQDQHGNFLLVLDRTKEAP
jgi:hypothetical protein